MTEARPPLLEVRGLVRRWPGVIALRGIDFSARAGEIHALVGANGAGKSTLMNILAGAGAPSAGEIRIEGAAVTLGSPADARRQGIATVYQEFSLVPGRSVAENIFLGQEPSAGRGRLGLVDRAAMAKGARTVLARLGLALEPDLRVDALGVAEQQMVEIARALVQEPRILILDEPTAVLSEPEARRLGGILRGLRDQGILVLFVSHHLSEVLALADRVTVLRDGAVVATEQASALDLGQLVSLMLGRPPAATAEDLPAAPTGAAPFQIGAEGGPLMVAPGEIVGLWGLVGAGRTALGQAIVGVGARPLPLRQGSRVLDNRSPRAALAEGVVYLTEDRKRDGIFAGLDIVANATATVLPRLATAGLRRPRAEHDSAARMLDRLRLSAASLRGPVARLSGGNQQKVVLARALLAQPKLLVFDEPTRGVDIGAKAEIHAILRQLAAGGVAVIVISSEAEEILTLADRIAVLRDGRLIDAFPVAGTDEARLLIAASGGPQPERSAP